jgi:hypothetical protein
MQMHGHIVFAEDKDVANLNRDNLSEINKIEMLLEEARFTESDKVCFEEIIEVLKKYNLIDKFGIGLLHDHFPIKEDEILLECTYPDDKTIHTETIRRDDVKDVNHIETAWYFDKKSNKIICSQVSKVF